MKRTLGALLILPLMVPLVAQAQETPQVHPGDRVRVTAPDCQLQKEKGTVSSFDGHIFSATFGERDIECPVEALTRLEVSVGERKWWRTGLRGTWITGGIGLVAGLVGCASKHYSEEGVVLCPAAIVAMALPVGFLGGAIIGLRGGQDQWEEVPLPPIRPSFEVSADGRFGFGFTIPLRR